QDAVAQVERLAQLGEVVGVVVEVVAVPWLARASVPAAVVRDRAEPVRGDVEQLIVPRVSAERPAVAEDDGLPGAPVLVVDHGPVRGGDGRRRFGCGGGHVRASPFGRGTVTSGGYAC